MFFPEVHWDKYCTNTTSKENQQRCIIVPGPLMVLKEIVLINETFWRAKQRFPFQRKTLANLATKVQTKATHICGTFSFYCCVEKQMYTNELWRLFIDENDLDLCWAFQSTSHAEAIIHSHHVPMMSNKCSHSRPLADWWTGVRLPVRDQTAPQTTTQH